MLVKILKDVSGRQGSYRAGQTADIDEYLARGLIDAGAATGLEPDPVVESATLKHSPKPRKRKK